MERDINPTRSKGMQMVKRDPEKTARNKRIKELSKRLKEMLPTVLEATETRNEQSLHAYFATRKAHYINLKHEIIPSYEIYLSLFIKGLLVDLDTEGNTSYGRFYKNLKESDLSKQYLAIFMERTFLREYESISKVRPNEQEAEVWIGQNKADYGLLVSPCFRNNSWRNDNSEIRRFKKRYWSVGHVLETGFVIPDTEKIHTFDTVKAYLDFFTNVLVRQSGSIYQRKIADMYCDFVRQAENPMDVLLLMPELRFLKDKKHKYRLDFCIIDVQSNNKVGFELSPWSTHGELKGTADKTQKQINIEASANFEKEMQKHKDYFRKHGIFTLIYTDSDITDIESVFADIQKYLLPQKVSSQLQLHLLSKFFDNGVSNHL